MGYFDDDYFIEYEEVYSDSKRRGAPQRRPSERRVSSQHKNARNSAVHNGYNRNTRSSSYHNDNFDRDPRGRKMDPDDFYSYTSRRRNVYGDSRGDTRERNRASAPQRPRQDQRKRKKSRLSRTTFFALCILVILTLLISVIAVAVSSSGVGEVSSLQAAEIAADRVTLSWEKANHAEGYRVLAAQGDAEELEEYQTIDDPDTLSVTVTGLEQATAYRFSVIALHENNQSKPVTLESVFTLPETPEITNSYSAKKGSIHLDWTGNDRADGYVVEYKKDGGTYSAEMTQTISDPGTTGADITDLEVNATYQIRVYAFLSQDKPLNSAPSAEEAIKVVDQDTEIVPVARPMKPAPGLDPDKPMIALTFDDGPVSGGGSSDRILDTLEQYNAKATFFMVGYNAGQNPDNVKRKADLMMELGNHTWDHTHYGAQVTPEDIRRASNQIYEITGRYSTAFRSPGGMSTEAILSECAAENMSAYYWSIDTQDWNSRDADSIYHAVVDHVSDGDIVLMHEIYDATADAVERMVPELIDMGYQLVTCHDLIALKGGAEPVPGTQYVDAYRTLSP